ncbi:MAG: thiol-disulfide oxidoreductase DCC family protein [Halobacteriaceae archaeon]
MYDDDCGFCTWCVAYARKRGEFNIVGFSNLSEDLKERLPENYERCAHLLTDDTVYSCGKATEIAIAHLSSPLGILGRLFQTLPENIRKHIREPLYRLVADNRDVFGKILSRTSL